MLDVLSRPGITVYFTGVRILLTRRVGSRLSRLGYRPGGPVEVQPVYRLSRLASRFLSGGGREVIPAQLLNLHRDFNAHKSSCDSGRGRKQRKQGHTTP